MADCSQWGMTGLWRGEKQGVFKGGVNWSGRQYLLWPHTLNSWSALTARRSPPSLTHPRHPRGSQVSCHPHNPPAPHPSALIKHAFPTWRSGTWRVQLRGDTSADVWARGPRKNTKKKGTTNAADCLVLTPWRLWTLPWLQFDSFVCLCLTRPLSLEGRFLETKQTARNEIADFSVIERAGWWYSSWEIAEHCWSPLGENVSVQRCYFVWGLKEAKFEDLSWDSPGKTLLPLKFRTCLWKRKLRFQKKKQLPLPLDPVKLKAVSCDVKARPVRCF